MMRLHVCSCAFLAAAMCCLGASRANETIVNFDEGEIELTSAGPLAFGPDGVLLVGDAKAATVYAINTGESSGNPADVSLDVEDLSGTFASALGLDVSDVIVNDLAVNPLTGTAYFSVSRGRGPDSQVVLLRMGANRSVEEFSLKDIEYSEAVLPNAADEDQTDRRGNSLRNFSITDIAFVDGRVVVAGLTNEEFSSNLRAIPYPFEETNSGTAIEVYHGAHGQYETHAPVRTFTPISINDEPFIVAAYTCTPLVRFPLSDISDGEKIRGTTVAELGNRNQPLDMFVYEREGKEFILMANSARGTMKISTEDIDRDAGIEERISDKAGQTYETIEELEGVVQLARLNMNHALAIIRGESGTLELKTVELP